MCVNCRISRRGFTRLAAGLAAASLAASRPARAGGTRPVIMIDPGHGGHDPGAIAPDGVYEKTITLASGLELRRVLNATGRYKVEMTRSTDVFVTLEGRVAAAISAGADLFLALHCDHLPTPSMRGASIFTLSDKASDSLAAHVANDENAADAFAPAGVKHVSPQVASILASLETRATKLGSETFAQDIQASFKGVIPLLPDPHRSANFAVLRDPSVPSTLLEMGCLTNRLDEKLLKSPAHRRLMAERLGHAIDAYFRDFSPNRFVADAG